MLLKNKLGLDNDIELAKEEERITKLKTIEYSYPFRERNGQITRIWLDMILKKELGKVVDWSKIDKEEYLLAMERSPIKNTEIYYKIF